MISPEQEVLELTPAHCAPAVSLEIRRAVYEARGVKPLELGERVATPDGHIGILIGLAGGFATVEHSPHCWSQCRAEELRRVG